MNTSMKRVSLYILLLILSINLINAQALSQRLDALLQEEVLRTSEVGITVFDLTTGEALYRYQDEKLYRPASIEKVITSVTALAQLGQDYTIDTRLCYTGIIENDTLRGNLYLVGGFDPEFMDEDLDRLVEEVANKGIRYVADTIAADVSMTDSVYWGPGWSWDDTPYSFQPYLSPLMLNRGCVDVFVSPTQQDSLPQVTCSPVSGYYTVDNRGVSRNPQAGKLKITRNWLSNGNVITISGNVVRPHTETLNVYSSQDFFFHTFVNRLQNKGISARAYAYADCPDSLFAASLAPSPTPSHVLPSSAGNGSTTVLFTLRRPIKEVLERALKKSDNLCAESMFYHLAARHALHKRVTAENGTDAIHAFMKTALGFNPDNYRIADGSGVSLYNYISPRLLLEYLKYAYYHRDIFLPLYESLPIAGVDGTLQHRMKQSKARGKVRAKTGSVTGVSSLAGYVKASNGHQLAFVIINQNVLKLSRARAFQDKVCHLLSQ